MSADFQANHINQDKIKALESVISEVSISVQWIYTSSVVREHQKADGGIYISLQTAVWRINDPVGAGTRINFTKGFI